MKETTALWQLKQYNNWVCWKREKKPDEDKSTKIPKNPHTGGNAQSNNPQTWGSFALAQAACQKYGFDGLAFMLDPAVVKLVGIDLDHCVNNGVVDPWALKIVKQLNSYTEISPSGKGLRIFIFGDLPPNGRKKGDIEMYESVRFLTITGNHLPGTPETIHDRSKEILGVHKEIWPPAPPQNNNGNHSTVVDNLDDYELLRRVEKTHGQKFIDLWAGIWNGNYPSHSEADLALCELLNFQSQGNADQIDRLFRQSGLMRPKWDERHYGDGKTHGEAVIEKALTYKHRDPNYHKNNGNGAGSTTQSNIYEELEKLLDDAINTEDATQIDKLKTFLEKLAQTDDLTINYFAEKAKEARLIGKVELKQEIKRLQKKEPPTHDILRDRWIAAHPLTAYGMASWRRYKNGVWAKVSEYTIKQEIEQVIEAAKKEGIDPTNYLLTSVFELARVKLAVDNEIWDAQPDFLVCANGTLHISSMTLLPHSPAYYATSGVSFDYDPDAQCPNWMSYLDYLEKALGKDVVEFLQEFAGYSLTVDTQFEIALWLYGTRGSGRSTFIEGLKAMLGDRSGLLGLADIERSRFALADLPGKTLVFSTEQPAQYVTTTDVINRIISGEPLKVEQKFKDAYEIRLRCKILWAMNQLPRIGGAEDGIFRRVKVVLFPALDESKRDTQLKEKIKTEGAGILNWALAGLTRLYQRGGFNIPQSVIDATEEFKEKNDIPANFVDDKCLTGLDKAGTPFSIASNDLYFAYREWCINNGHKPLSSTSIADEWKRLGFEKYKANGVRRWRYVMLKV